LIGQRRTREACGIVADLIQHEKMAGRVFLLVGPRGTGKTALAAGIGHAVGKGNFKIPSFLSSLFERSQENGSLDGTFSQGDWFDRSRTKVPRVSGMRSAKAISKFLLFSQVFSREVKRTEV
jgi:stage III sporulation protein SpoIIIAA